MHDKIKQKSTNESDEIENIILEIHKYYYNQAEVTLFTTQNMTKKIGKDDCTKGANNILKDNINLYLLSLT